MNLAPDPPPTDEQRVAGYVAIICHRYDAITDREPWKRLSRKDRLDHLPPLLDCLLRAALLPDADGHARRETLDNALIHGEHRRAQQFDEEVLLEEYSVLRDQMHRVLRSHHDVEGASNIMRRTDPLVTEATVASLRGFHGLPLDEAPGAAES